MSEEETVTVDLFVRSLAPIQGRERQEALLGRLEQLTTDGQVDEFSVHVWGDAVATDSALAKTDAGKGVRTLVASFRQWALAENVSVEQFFEKREVSSSMTGDSYSALTLPSVAIAEYEDGELVGMGPHDDGTDTVTVRAYLDALASRRGQSLREGAEAASRLAVHNGD